jgi:peptidoglycan/LPS O-acetylase OafA/YrhL
VLLALGLRWRKVSWVLVGTAVAIFAVCILTLIDASPTYSDVYTYPTSWAVTILIGAGAYLARQKVASWLPRRSAVMVLLAVAALAALSLVPNAKASASSYLVGGPVIAVLTVVLINYVRHWQTLPFAALRLALWLGRVSYAAYLWNYPIVVWLVTSGKPSVVSLPLTVLAATISWWAVERPVSVVKRRLDRRSDDPDETATVAASVGSPSSGGKRVRGRT